MTIFITLLLSTVFILLSSIHLYWGFGGKWAVEDVYPTKEDGSNLSQTPGTLSTFIVAVGLLLFAIFYLIKGKIIIFEIPTLMDEYGYGILITIFSLRALGEFHYIGLFKKIKRTPFGRKDTLIYTPLCIFISVLTMILMFL